MVRPLSLVAAVAGTALAADTTTINVLIIGDKAPFVGSVVKAEPQATTLEVKCKPGTPSESCGLPAEGATIVQGPSTWMWTYSMSNKESGFTQDANCQLDPPKDLASCKVTVTQDIDGKRTTQSSASVQSGYKSWQYPVVITAGANLLSASPGATPTGDVSATSPAQSSAATVATNQPSRTDAAAASSTKGTNAAGPMATKNAVLAGVVAVVGGVLAL
ncbi:hypothetical protein QQS21_001424 [Conoideocrella luteorostrata]|uniref:Uncharacterized protein n=1 Tax=Conoideocrella luteorostrata TaxID=1105319 RepID=A0AAJ0CWW5_9HYPO|nr:hypothetical protein QQS21_001424 [Conoideocrella luteorostrata]